MRRTGLLGFIVFITAAILAFMFGHVFDNMAALSTGFLERKATSATIGLFCLVIGFMLLWFIRNAYPGEVTWRHIMGTTLASSVLAWFIFAGVIFSIQDRLVFSPRTLSPERHQRIREQQPHIEEVTIPTEDGHTLHGWIVPPKQGDYVPLIILFAGQGGEASRYFEFAERLPDFAWAFINYRGYGLSTGRPSDAALFGDSLAIYDYFAARPDIDQANIFALGGSLGTGVATYLASERPLAGVILFSPYDRIGGGVAQDLVRFAPTRLLLSNQFDAIRFASTSQAAALAIVGDRDAVIRPARSQNLMRSWRQPHEVVIIPGGDHYSIYEDTRSWQAIEAFVQEHLR